MQQGYDKVMKNLCEKCEKRDICEKLCPEAEKYAGQDYVPQRELLYRTGDVIDVFEENELPIPPMDWGDTFLKKKEQIILMYLFDGKTQQEIAADVGVDKAWVSRVLRDARQKLDKS